MFIDFYRSLYKFKLLVSQQKIDGIVKIDQTLPLCHWMRQEVPIFSSKGLMNYLVEIAKS